VAILASLFAVTFLTCLGMALVLLGSAATTIAARDGQAAAAAYAAQAAATLSVSELRTRVAWTGAVMPGALPDVAVEPGDFTDATYFPRAPWDGSALDLHTLTAQWQAASDAAAPGGLPGPVWRLFEYGPISRLIPSEPRRHPFYVAVWTADGRGGVLLVRATAWGTGGVRASVEASIGPGAGQGRVRLAMRAVR
jgi:hypothetical protein